MKQRSLYKFLDWRDWRWEKLGLALVSRAVLSKTLIQLSAYEWGCAPFLSVVWPGVRNAVLGCNLKNNRVISVHFQGKPFNIRVIQVYAPTINGEEAKVEWFFEDLQDLLKLTPKRDVLFLIVDWNTKVGSQEIPGVTGKLGLGVQNEAGQRLIEFCQENILVRENTLFRQHKRRL